MLKKKILLCVFLIESILLFKVQAQLRDNHVVNVKDFGAKGDGIADDSKAINNAVTGLITLGKSTLFFPRGSYKISSTIRLHGNKIEIIGESAQSTILKADHVVDILATNGKINDSLIIRNIGFDVKSTKSAAIRVLGSVLQDRPTLIEHCDFYGADLYNIWLDGARNVTISDNIFRGEGKGRGTGIELIHGCNQIRINDNKFLYLLRGVYIVGRIPNYKTQLLPNTNIIFSNNYVDLAWYLLPPKYEGEGSRIVYTENSIYDPGANFKSLNKEDNIRVLQPLLSGYVSETGADYFIDNCVDFVSSAIKKGDLIRIGNKEALIDSVTNKNKLLIEKWIFQADLKDTKKPDEGSYKISRIIMGKVKNYSENKIIVWRFYDFYGNEVTPKTGWLYEILFPHPDYPFFATVNNSNFTINNNIFKRGWADQVAINGENATITGNLISDGQDMGITLLGKGHSVCGNKIVHQRTGIWMECENSIFKDNEVIDCEWATDYDVKPRAYLYVRGMNNKISNNTFKRNLVSGKPNIEAVIVNKSGEIGISIANNTKENIR